MRILVSANALAFLCQTLHGGEGAGRTAKRVRPGHVERGSGKDRNSGSRDHSVRERPPASRHAVLSLPTGLRGPRRQLEGTPFTVGLHRKAEGKSQCN